jgi:hypothetical protein
VSCAHHISGIFKSNSNQAAALAIVRFFVGEGRQPVGVYAQVMASLSEPLDHLINGPMKEGQEKTAAIPNVEFEIFLRLVEFTYCGDYTMRPYPFKDADFAKKDREDFTAMDKE